MKLKVSYDKTPSGRIRVRLSVDEVGEFPSHRIFSSEGDYPADPQYTLRGYPEGYYSIVATFGRAEEASAWAEAQVEALHRHLQEWRQSRVPEDQNFVV